MKKMFAILLALSLALAALTVPALAEKTVITLSHSGTVTLNVGDVLQLGATVAPEAPVSWTSGKVKVATVDANGLVYAVAEGTATIKAKAGGKTAKLKIKVIDPYKPTGVSIAQGKAVTIGVGDAVQLSAVLTPSTAQAALTWTSKKPGIAAVDGNGIVTGIARGKTKVTVKAGKKKATVTVNVINPNEPTGITLSHSGTVQICENEYLQLYASLQPANAIGNIEWSSSKASVATVDANGAVTLHKKGTATITARCGKVKATVKVKVVSAEQHQHSWQDVTENRYVVDSPAWDETVVVTPAWDETVVVKEAWDEQTGYTPMWDETVVITEPYDETVTVPAWTETVVDKEAWTETIPYVLCNAQRRDGERCNKRWYSMEEYQKDYEYCTPLDYEFTWWQRSLSEEELQHLISAVKEEGWSAELCARMGCKYPEAGAADFCSHWCFTSGQEYIEHPAETQTVEHPEETKVIHHDVGTETIHHESEPYITHHDAETTVVHHDAVTQVVHHDEVGHWGPVVIARVCQTCGAIG